MKRYARSVGNLQSVLKYSDVVRWWYARIMLVPSSVISHQEKNWSLEPVIMSDIDIRVQTRYGFSEERHG
jgi:hypothetical protein